MRLKSRKTRDPVFFSEFPDPGIVRYSVTYTDPLAGEIKKEQFDLPDDKSLDEANEPFEQAYEADLAACRVPLDAAYTSDSPS